MTIYLSLLVAVVGAMTYALASNVKLIELARLAWLAGLLAFLLRIAELPSIRSG